MERTDILELMSTLKLYGMRAAYDEVMTTGIKRRHEPPRIVGDLLSAEIAEKQARSIKYQLTIAKLPLAKDIDDFDFTGTPVNEALIRDLASGAFLAEQRNAVLIGGTGTGKSHLAIAIARACIRGGARGRFYTVVDLVNPFARIMWSASSVDGAAKHSGDISVSSMVWSGRPITPVGTYQPITRLSPRAIRRGARRWPRNSGLAGTQRAQLRNPYRPPNRAAARARPRRRQRRRRNNPAALYGNIEQHGCTGSRRSGMPNREIERPRSGYPSPGASAYADVSSPRRLSDRPECGAAVILLGRSFYFEKTQVIDPAGIISAGRGVLLATAWSGRRRAGRKAWAWIGVGVATRVKL